MGVAEGFSNDGPAMTSSNRTFLRLTTVFCILCVAGIVEAATFVVPPDREMIRRADAIVIATPSLSYSQVTKDGIETVTRMSVEETIKGPATNDSINIVEPGGEVGNLFSYVAGAPRFEIGQRVLLFLTKTGPDRWSATDLVLGKFSFAADEKGQRLLARDADEIVGWNPDLSAHHERARAEDGFLRFVREEVAARRASEDYFVDTTPAPRTRTGRFSAIANAGFTATSYTMTISGSQGSRWNTFPSGVTFFASASGEPGAPGNGTTAVQTAIASWDNDPGSNINYVYGGTDSTHTQGLHAADGANTVLFERDLSSWGVTPFTCTSNSYSGTLGLGGITSASGTHTLGSETFVTTREGDVEMNRGLANCTLLFNNGDFNSALTHEIGHTLGFRHSDQTRDSSGACANDPSLECSNQAIMKSFISQGLNANLQPWDQHAAAAVYPGSTNCTPPTITTQPLSRTINRGQAVNIAVSVAGTAPFSYQWYQGASGNTSAPVSTDPSINVAPTATTSYWVRVSNACGSVNSATATITVNTTSCTPPAITSQPQSQTITRGQAVNIAVTASGTAPFTYQWYQGASGDTTTPVANSQSINVAPATTTSYWVRVTNACGGINSATATITVTQAAASVRGDFNGDGNPDLLWRNFSTGENRIWLLSASRAVLSVVALPTLNLNWQIAGVGDFDGDGNQDILLRNYVTGTNNAWLMLGTTVQGTVAVTGDSNVDRFVESVNDFNGDGKPDLVWRNHTTGAVYIWLMNGVVFSSLANLPSQPDLNWQIAGSGDFDGNGKPDILWRNYSNGNNQAWLMSGTTFQGTAAVTGDSNVDRRIDAVADFSHDGKADLVWRNYTTGADYIWLMNNVSFSSLTTLPTDSNLNWHIVGPR
jgi:hypothetical protein